MIGLDGKLVKVHSSKINVNAQAVAADAAFVKEYDRPIEFKESLAGTKKSLPFKYCVI